METPQSLTVRVEGVAFSQFGHSLAGKGHMMNVVALKPHDDTADNTLPTSPAGFQPVPLTGLLKELETALDQKETLMVYGAADAWARNKARAAQLPAPAVELIAETAMLTVQVCLKGNHSPYSTITLLESVVQNRIDEMLKARTAN